MLYEEYGGLLAFDRHLIFFVNVVRVTNGFDNNKVSRVHTHITRSLCTKTKNSRFYGEKGGCAGPLPSIVYSYVHPGKLSRCKSSIFEKKYTLLFLRKRKRIVKIIRGTGEITNDGNGATGSRMTR